jgi:hypothetical protein
MVLITRDQALAAGLGKFFIGEPCKRGHVSERYIGYRPAGRCVECLTERAKAKYQADARHRETIRDRQRFRWAVDIDFRQKSAAAKNKARGMPEPVRLRPEACEMCGRIQKKALHLDHDHATGKFRGWLCNQCNTGLGLLGDSITAVERAITYLRRAVA